MKTAEDIVKDSDKAIISVSYDQTIYQAARKMIEKKIDAILVTKNDDYIGIWSEKDLLLYITDPEFDSKTAKIGDYMSSPVYGVPHDARIHKLEEMFAGCLFIIYWLRKKENTSVSFLSEMLPGPVCLKRNEISRS